MIGFVYDYFFRGKDSEVKVYSTKPNAKPVKVKSSLLRKSYPYMIASVMALSSCSTRNKDDFLQNKTDDIELNAEIQKIDKKSCLSQEKIEDLFNEQAVLTCDDNYNHIPDNCNNFWDIIKSGIMITKQIQESAKLTDSQKKEYLITARKMLSRIVVDEDNMDNVDLSDQSNLKAFLYFEKVVKHRDDYDFVLKKRDGMFDAQSDALGKYYKDLYLLYEVVKQNPVISDFAEALYNSDNRYILSYEDSIKVNKESMEIARDWIRSQQIENDNLYLLSNVNENPWCNSVAVWQHRGGDYEALISIDRNGDCGDGFYSPIGEIVVHELTHLMQLKPFSSEYPSVNSNKNNMEIFFRENPSISTEELGPSLMSLVIDDYLYKKLKGIEQDKVVEYGKIDVNGKNIELGEVAVWFKDVLKEKTNEGTPFSVDKILSEPDVYGKILEFCKKDNSFRLQLSSNYQSR